MILVSPSLLSFFLSLLPLLLSLPPSLLSHLLLLGGRKEAEERGTENGKAPPTGWRGIPFLLSSLVFLLPASFPLPSILSPASFPYPSSSSAHFLFLLFPSALYSVSSREWRMGKGRKKERWQREGGGGKGTSGGKERRKV